nr:MAG TPA_asm: hypothetical protein [Caudoviricetes sp.]
MTISLVISSQERLSFLLTFIISIYRLSIETPAHRSHIALSRSAE